MSAGKPARRLFFSLNPDQDTLEAICALQRRIATRGQGRPVPPERIHATLLFLGNQSSATLDRLKDIARELEFPRSQVTLDRCGHFPRARVAWLGPSRTPRELQAFQERLCASVAAAGVSFDPRPWRMHVTLYRDLRKPPGRIPFEPVEWMLRDFRLMESVQGKPGLQYLCRGRWPA